MRLYFRLLRHGHLGSIRLRAVGKKDGVIIFRYSWQGGAIVPCGKIGIRKDRIMEDESRFWLSLLLGLALCVTIISCWAFQFNIQRTKMFIDAGYTRECVIGYDWPQWVLPEKESDK